MRGNESPCLAHRWPLLAHGQDPASLEARVAYHLRRLGIAWRAVRETRLLPRDELADLVQGRLRLSEPIVRELATHLGVALAELSRDLTVSESDAWSFYRESVRHRMYVWQRARAIWERGGLSLRLAAAVMELRPYQLTHALLNPERRLVLSYEAATRLAIALEIEGGAQFFTAHADLGLPPEHDINEVVQPLSEASIAALYRTTRNARSSRAPER